MNSIEYKNIISEKDVLNYSTLNTTLKELYATKKLKLVSEIEKILKSNKIVKPELHSDPNNQTTDYFKIDLTLEEIAEIANMFFELEVQYAGENGETTPACAFYASLADKWAALNFKV